MCIWFEHIAELSSRPFAGMTRIRFPIEKTIKGPAKPSQPLTRHPLEHVVCDSGAEKVQVAGLRSVEFVPSVKHFFEHVLPRHTFFDGHQSTAARAILHGNIDPIAVAKQ